VTLHHFTLPRWFAERGGWRAPGAAEHFARYVAATAPVIGADVRHVCTINEPNVLAALADLTADGGDRLPSPGPPVPDPELTAALVEAHRAAVFAVKEISPDIQAGWSVANQVYQAVPGAEDVAAAHRRPREDVFLEAARADDWIGVQACTRTRIGRH